MGRRGKKLEKKSSRESERGGEGRAGKAHLTPPKFFLLQKRVYQGVVD